jgi:large subunit ribosomal protein L32
MAHPKRQHSKQRGRKRRGHDGLTVPSSIDRKSTGSQYGVMHRVDPVTGFYNGRQVIQIKAKEKKASE